MLSISNANVVDVRTGEIQSGQTLELQDGHIQKISSSSRNHRDVDIDLGGRFVVPGLVSCHAHLSAVYPFASADPHEASAAAALRAASRAREALHAGVTTIRCVGESGRADIFLKEAEVKGLVESPRVLAGGRMLSVTGGHGHSFFGRIANGADAWLEAAREELHLGADHIKVCLTGGIAEAGENLSEMQMTDNEIASAVRATREHQTYVVAHAASAESIKRGLALGIRSFEHGYEMDDECVEAMAAQGVFYGATLCVTRMPTFMKWQGFTPWQIERSQSAGKRHMESFRRAVSAGVKLVNSTDYAPGAPSDGTTIVVREMEHMMEGGVTPLGALQAATVNGAELCGLEDELGTVQEGKCADLLILQSDPVTDAASMRGICGVIHRGRVVRYA